MGHDRSRATQLPGKALAVAWRTTGVVRPVDDQDGCCTWPMRFIGGERRQGPEQHCPSHTPECVEMSAAAIMAPLENPTATGGSVNWPRLVNPRMRAASAGTRDARSVSSTRRSSCRRKKA
jgi:hypothetical protein